MEQQERRYWQICLKDEICTRLLEALKRITRFDVASKAFGTELYEVAAVYTHPLTSATGSLNVVSWDKSEIGNHGAFRLKNLRTIFDVF